MSGGLGSGCLGLQGRVDAARLFGQRLEQILFKLGARRSTWDPKAWRLCASAVGPDHLLASGAKYQAGGHAWALATSPKRLVLIAHSIRPRFEYLTSGYL